MVVFQLKKTKKVNVYEVEIYPNKDECNKNMINRKTDGGYGVVHKVKI
jgi:hypothetical protein